MTEKCRNKSRASCHTRRDRLDRVIKILLRNVNRNEGGFGQIKPMKPKLYVGKRKTLSLNMWFRETEMFLNQSRVQDEHWTEMAAKFLDGAALHWYLAGENIYAMLDWQDFKERMRQYFIPQNE